MNALPMEQWEQLFGADGVKFGREAEVAQRFPASWTLHQHVGDSHISSTNDRATKLEELIEADGVSNYSTAYWEAFEGGRGGRRLERAINETLAETTRLIVSPVPGLAEQAELREKTKWVDFVEGLARLLGRELPLIAN